MPLPCVSVSAYDHITANLPDTIGTRKSNVVELAEYSGGGPRGKCKCCMLFVLFTLSVRLPIVRRTYSSLWGGFSLTRNCFRPLLVVVHLCVLAVSELECTTTYDRPVQLICLLLALLTAMNDASKACRQRSRLCCLSFLNTCSCVSLKLSHSQLSSSLLPSYSPLSAGSPSASSPPPVATLYHVRRQRRRQAARYHSPPPSHTVQPVQMAGGKGAEQPISDDTKQVRTSAAAAVPPVSCRTCCAVAHSDTVIRFVSLLSWCLSCLSLCSTIALPLRLQREWTASTCSSPLRRGRK